MSKIKRLGISGITPVRGLGITPITPIQSLGLSSFGNDKDYKADFYGLKRGEGINFLNVINFLKSSNKPKLIYDNYRGASRTETQVIGTDGVLEVTRIVDVPFNYTNQYKQKIEASIKCGINKKYDYVENVPYASFYLNHREKSFEIKVAYFYEKTKNYRKEVVSTASKNDFYIDDKYVGIKLTSQKIVDLYYFLVEIQGKENAEWYKTLVNRTYIPLLENCKSSNELIWLYENAADFTLAELKPEVLWKHICQFYNYDVSGTFSFLKDASSQLMRALFAFNTPEKIKYLMEQFHKNQNFIKKIYDALDGSISFMGKEQKCQTIFASILTGFCFAETSKLNFTNEIFYVGKDYYVNVKEVESDDKEQSKYWVEQRHKTETYNVDSGTAIIEMGGDMVVTSRIKMNPLDIVTLLQKDTNSLIFVPVLFLKDIDHQKDVENLLTAVRIGVDMLAIGLTVATLGGASPLLALAGALEITIAATDIAVMTNKDLLSEEFLQTWEKIYVIGGIATASPAVVSSLYKLGGKILASSAKIEMKNFVQSCMMKMILESEISNFSKNTLKIANEETIKKASGFFFDKYSFKPFWEQGCQFVYGGVKVGAKVENHIAIIYKNVSILQGEEREIRSQLMKLYGARFGEARFAELLENLYKLTPKLDETKKFWTCFNEAGTEMKWLNQKARTVNLTDDINKALKSVDESKVWVGEIAQELGIENITNFNNKFLKIINGKVVQELGDLDVGTTKYFIEAKKSISLGTITQDINDVMEQLDKYCIPIHQKFINIQNKPVILAVKEFRGGANIYTKEVQDLLKEYKTLKIVVGKNNIKTLK